MILDEEHGELDHEKNIPIQFGSMALLLPLPQRPFKSNLLSFQSLISKYKILIWFF
jgi:hypothetical protein